MRKERSEMSVYQKLRFKYLNVFTFFNIIGGNAYGKYNTLSP